MNTKTESSIDLPIEECQRTMQEVRGRLALEAANMSFGYIGNLTRWGDDRAWAFFVNVGGKPRRFGDVPTERLPMLAVRAAYELELWVRNSPDLQRASHLAFMHGLNVGFEQDDAAVLWDRVCKKLAHLKWVVMDVDPEGVRRAFDEGIQAGEFHRTRYSQAAVPDPHQRVAPASG